MDTVFSFMVAASSIVLRTYASQKSNLYIDIDIAMILTTALYSL